MQIFGFLGNILGYALWAAFYVFQNFGLAIIVFTIIVKLLILPFSVKQQKSMAGTARLSKKQKELKEKYGNNRQLLQEEMNKLYEKEGIKPMGGCLTTIVPMLVLFGVFYAVAYPLTNTLHLNGDAVNSAVTYMSKIPGYVANSNPSRCSICLSMIGLSHSRRQSIRCLLQTTSRLSTTSPTASECSDSICSAYPPTTVSGQCT